LLQNVAMLLQHRLVVTASAHSKLQERLNGLIQTIELELRGWQYLTLQIAAVARMLANGIDQRSQLSNGVEAPQMRQSRHAVIPWRTLFLQEQPPWSRSGNALLECIAWLLPNGGGSSDSQCKNRYAHRLSGKQESVRKISSIDR